MLTPLKEIFTWWNRQTLGTRIYTLFLGKFAGEDAFGNADMNNDIDVNVVDIVLVVELILND